MTSFKKHIFMFAGELSGDMHGGMLIRALKPLLPELTLTGVGGPQMRAQGVECVLKMEDFEVMGFSDVLISLPRLWRQFNKIRDHILATNPDVAVFIDSAGLSLRMARALRKRGYKGKIVQYICPAVWAWGKERIAEMAETLDALLTIYPFENKYFADTKLKVHYVGNPLQEHMRLHNYDPHWKQIFGIKPSAQLVGLFPGSRKGEIHRNLPVQLEAAKLLQKQNPEISFVISCSHQKNTSLIKDMIQKSDLPFGTKVYVIPKMYTYELMRACRSAIAKSGTVTLELALHKCPSVVVYELSFLNWFIAKYIYKVNLPYYCIVNILKEQQVFPELIDKDSSGPNVYKQLKALHEEGDERGTCLAGCRDVIELLKEGNASEQAAKAIAELVA